MDSEAVKTIKKRIPELREPENLYEGIRLPRNFALPDNILFFYHDFPAQAPVAHHRYTLVFPLASMRYYVDDQKFDIREGDLLLIRPYSRRFMIPQSKGYQRFFITFELPEEQAYLPQSCLNRLTEKSSYSLEKLFDFFSGDLPENLSLALWEFLSHLAPDTHSQERVRLSSEIANAVKFINEQLDTPLKNSIIASRVNMSPGNLARRFRQEMGMALHEYISEKRLEMGRYCLQKTSMRTEEIARCCGFLSSSSFSHFFASRTSLSPLAYRRKSRVQEKMIPKK